MKASFVSLFREATAALGFVTLAACAAPAPPPPPPAPCPAPALASVLVDGVDTKLAESWPSPARLVNRWVSGSYRHLSWERHRGDAGVNMDPEGLHILIRNSYVAAMWARVPGETTFTKILDEPWIFDSLRWDGDDFEICRVGKAALQVSLRHAPATWRIVARATCRGPNETWTGQQHSRDGVWAARIITRSECAHAHRMPDGLPPDECKFFHDIVVEGKGSLPKHLHGGETVPALSPSGKYLAFQDLKGVIVVYETGSRTLRTTNVSWSHGRHGILWVPDESVFALTSESGGVQLISPTTGTELGGLNLGILQNTAIVLDPITGEPGVAKRWRTDPVRAAKGRVALPDDAEKTWSFPELRRRAAFAKGAWVLWDETSGRALRTTQGVVSVEPSPSRRFVAVLRDVCDKPVVCAASLELVELASGHARYTLDLPGVTVSSKVTWLGSGDGEIAAIVEHDARFVRMSDGVVLHVETPDREATETPVMWTEDGLVDGSPDELARWTFRPAGVMDHVVAATELHHPGLWRDFRDGKPLRPPDALAPRTAP